LIEAEALVDTGATRLYLKPSVIKALGLQKVGKVESQTTNGTRTAVLNIGSDAPNLTNSVLLVGLGCGSFAFSPFPLPDAQLNGSYTQQISRTVGCQNGTWKFVVKSSQSGSTSVSQCVSVQVACMMCCPPPGCELE
jgi:hypothetical protein